MRVSFPKSCRQGVVAHGKPCSPVAERCPKQTDTIPLNNLKSSAHRVLSCSPVLACEGKLTFRTGDGCAKVCLFGYCDFHVETQDCHRFAKLLRLRGRDFEANNAAASGCIDGGMDSIGIPFDEERKQASVIVLEIESIPLEETTVGTFAGAGIGAVEGDVCVAETRREFVEIARMSGPAD